MTERATTRKAEGVSHGPPPYYAYLEHPDGRWYATWMTHTEPRTERGHPWHVHADYSAEERLHFTRADDWFMAQYGMRNWDFDTVEEAVGFFLRERLQTRLGHGYRLIQGHLPEASQ